MKFFCRKVKNAPAMTADWDDEAWRKAEIAPIAFVCPANDLALGTLPDVQVRLMHDDDCIYGMYLVRNEIDVICDNKQYHGRIWEDSCVELFLKPFDDAGYFNLEMNAGGYHLVSYNVFPDGVNDFRKRLITPLPAELGMQVKILVRRLSETDWCLQFALPISIFNHYLPRNVDMEQGRVWRGSFYKCAEKSRRPHWLSWQELPVTAFHLPDTFGNIEF